MMKEEKYRAQVAKSYNLNPDVLNSSSFDLHAPLASEVCPCAPLQTECRAHVSCISVHSFVFNHAPPLTDQSLPNVHFPRGILAFSLVAPSAHSLWPKALLLLRPKHFRRLALQQRGGQKKGEKKAATAMPAATAATTTTTP